MTTARDFLEQLEAERAERTGTVAKIESLCVKVRANFGVKLMELASGELVARGPLLDSFRDGARYQGKYYEYLSYRLTSEALLSNPTFLGLARQRG